MRTAGRGDTLAPATVDEQPAPSAGPAGAPDEHRADTGAALLLGRLHRARARGDADAARRAWHELVAAELPRVRGIARGFRHHALPGGRIPAADIDDLASDVFLRLHRHVGALRGETTGELRAFLRRATTFVCQDHVARHVRDDRRRAASLDDDAPATAAARDLALARLAEQFAGAREEQRDDRALVHAALSEVDPEKRAVLVMDQAGLPIDEIMQRLGIGRDAVYQRRRRGLLQLGRAARELLDEEVAT